MDANILAGNLDLPYKFKIWNVGSGRNHSINEVADLIGGEKVYIKTRPAEVRITLADIEGTKKELGWNPSHSLEDVINTY